MRPPSHKFKLGQACPGHKVMTFVSHLRRIYLASKTLFRQACFVAIFGGGRWQIIGDSLGVEACRDLKS